jgi:hypothetical protein
MTGHTVLLLSAARGAAMAYRKKTWGVHIACHIHRFPQDDANQRMWWLCLYLPWLYGARIIYDEESAIIMFHGEKYSFSNKFPAERRQIMREFNNYARSNPICGKPVIDIGLVQGNLSVINGGLNIGNVPLKVWGGLGPESKGWEYLAPERTWRIADLFLPGVWLSPVKQNLRQARPWFSGTPYGQVDLVPANAPADVLSTYRFLIFLGWNTMTEEQYIRMKTFVQNGGILFMALPHLSTHTKRGFLLDGGDLNLFNGGDLSDLFGIKIESPFTKSSRSRLPLIVQNRLGRGTVCLMTTWNYPGTDKLVSMAKNFLCRLLREQRRDVWLEDTGDAKDVNYFVFSDPATRRRTIYMVNVDWTVKSNVKNVLVCLKNKRIPAAVRQGELAVYRFTS